MRSRITTIILIAILTGTMAMGGCSDDDNTTAPPPPDVDPPFVTSISVANASQISVFFNEPVEELTAQRAQNYLIVKRPTPQSAMTAAPGDTIQAATAVLVGQSQVFLSTFQSMEAIEYDVFVIGVSDLRGNIITTPVSRRFTGTDIADQIPPEIVSVSPRQQAGNVGVRQSVVVRFDEPMNETSVFAAFKWERASDGVDVPFQASVQEPNIFVFTPLVDLELFTRYTTTVTGIARDAANNAIDPPIFWFFTTTATGDLLRPTLVSTNPADGNFNVARDVLIRLTFTEPMDIASVENGASIEFFPNPGDGIFTTTDGGLSIRFSPDSLLAASTQYTILIPEGGLTDLAGNPLDATTTVQFTTGPSLAGGRIAGKVTGDPSTEASDPQGTTVIATNNSPFAEEDDDLQVRGTGDVRADSAYAIDRLPDGVYYPFGILDSNKDGFLDPETGDAVGALGVDFRQNDLTPDNVLVSNGGTVNDVNFPLFDPMAISGTVFYVGTTYAATLANFNYYVGAFDTTTFDTTSTFPPADFGTEFGARILESPRYRLSEFNTENVAAGTYWIGGFLDINGDTNYDPENEPAGFFMVNDQAFPITIEDGKDAIRINILLEDPSGGMALRSGWHGGDGQVSERTKLLQRFRANALRALGQAEPR